MYTDIIYKPKKWSISCKYQWRSNWMYYLEYLRLTRGHWSLLMNIPLLTIIHGHKWTNTERVEGLYSDRYHQYSVCTIIQYVLSIFILHCQSFRITGNLHVHVHMELVYIWCFGDSMLTILLFDVLTIILFTVLNDKLLLFWFDVILWLNKKIQYIQYRMASVFHLKVNWVKYEIDLDLAYWISLISDDMMRVEFNIWNIFLLQRFWEVPYKYCTL